MEGPKVALALDVLSAPSPPNAVESTSDSESSNSEEEITVLDEIEKKYLCDDDFDRGNTVIMFGTSPCDLASARALELVVLNSLRINASGNLKQLATHLRRVVEVDLSFNNINSWNTVSDLLRHLPTVKTFNISKNPLPSEIDCEFPVCSKLGALVLNGNCPSLRSLRKMLYNTPMLEELHLADNDFRASGASGDEKTPISNKINVLNLSNCCLETWDDALNVLQFFPKCARLVIGNNGFTRITKTGPDSVNTNSELLSAVRSLCLNGCNFQDWGAIESLAVFSALDDLRVRNIPLFQGMPDEERHHLVVARLPLLKTLNGSVLSPDRREESERFFLRFYQLQETKPSVYDSLVAIHGHVEQLAQVDLTPKKYAVVEFTCEETGLKKTLQVKLAMMVQSLKTKAEQLTGIPANSMRVFYIARNFLNGEIPTLLNLPQQTLRSLHVSDGDRFEFQTKVSTRNRKGAVTKTVK
uniref:Ubiquitin-like domain-containing protein n=1 Tax=Steinernema glaseri TaxID=37863 RepID=A0A1I7ZJV3_9BILA